MRRPRNIKGYLIGISMFLLTRPRQMKNGEVFRTDECSGIWVKVLQFLKALVWPAFLVFELLKFAGA